MKPRYSVIIPTFNEEAWIDDTLAPCASGCRPWR